MFRFNIWSLSSWCLVLFVAAAGLSLTAQNAIAADDAWSSTPAKAGGKIVIRIAMVEDEDENPAAAGKAAAEKLNKMMDGTPLKAVVVSECFEDLENKEKVLAGICAVVPREIVLGGATYGSFCQKGVSDFDSVCLLGIGGDGISVAAALVANMGTSKLTVEEHLELIRKRLNAAGAKLADKLRKTDRDRLCIVIPDTHAVAKTQALVAGIQQVTGKQFPITGGCVCKNAGQTFSYFRGKACGDSAVALMLSGDFSVSLAGRKAKDNDKVISTAGEAATEALRNLQGKPIAAIGFGCAGRRSKLKNIDDELLAIRKVIGEELPLFGCWCAGEIGPVDSTERIPGVLSGGGGWHLMFTVIGR